MVFFFAWHCTHHWCHCLSRLIWPLLTFNVRLELISLSTLHSFQEWLYCLEFWVPLQVQVLFCMCYDPCSFLITIVSSKCRCRLNCSTFGNSSHGPAWQCTTDALFNQLRNVIGGYHAHPGDLERRINDPNFTCHLDLHLLSHKSCATWNHRSRYSLGAEGVLSSG